PEGLSEQKIKKSGDGLRLTFRETPDILKTLGRDKGNRILVGFAAETENILENAVEKARQKNLDLVCANQVGLADRGFGSDTNAISIVMPDGSHEEFGPAPKYEIAMAILDKVKSLIG
ncbi:MAG TPA: bifunctional 4'-phosphopantothenoylcysteine decarboxylase/phosphopantothenoylcysteine synthetase, partial [Clostridiales bacterium UBA9857]|nr:bifunctional 4'-phosphopantothenoylcysteine decarboxylase/phosphopantothenoylcysteine synthetase [Clostridiales bacterium UBA9857]